MPRTKQPKKQSSISQETELLLEDINKQFQIVLKDIENERNMAIKRISSRIDSALGRMIKGVREMTLEELFNINFQDENNDFNSDSRISKKSNVDTNAIVPPTNKKSKMVKRQTALSADDGYATERPTLASQKSTTKRSSRIDSKRLKTLTKSTSVTRSSSTNLLQETDNSTNKRSTSNIRSSKNSKFMTPGPSDAKTPKFGIVIPKAKPNTPLNILRRPRDGEMVLSMQGSPLLMSAVTQGRMANVNVPLHNGNIMSLLPTDGLRFSDIPNLDDETKNQLAKLKSHIEKVMGKQ